MDRHRKLHRIGLLLLIAVSLTIGQIVLATLSARGGSWHDRYLSLCTWDGGWYADVIDNGYRTTSPPDAGQQSNVAFFPGYPVTAGIVSRCFGLSAPVALLLTSQFSTLVFWLSVLLLLGRWQVPKSGITATVMLLFCQPGAFYFVVSYSEPLFFACFVIFIFLGPCIKQSWAAFAGACVAGYVMSATRILGAPLALLPLIWAYNDIIRLPKISDAKRILIAIVAKYSVLSAFVAFGTISFFIYCAVRFGHWNQYMRAGTVGWVGNRIDYTNIFAPRRYRLRMPRFYEDFLSHWDVTRLYIPILALLLLTIIGADIWLSFRKRLTAFSERAPFYVTAVLLFLICASASNPSIPYPIGFIRYGLYSSVPIILALAHVYRSSSWRRAELPLGAQLGVFVLCAVSLALQLQFCWRYTRAIFVA
jgi:hypothetical protein